MEPIGEFGARPKRAAGLEKADASLLGLWWNDPTIYDERHRLDIAEMLEAAVLPKEPRWRKAARGDAPSAINLAIRVVLLQEPKLAPYRAVILIALWRCAADGDPTAALVMDWLREHPNSRPF